ncbi:hypothetical protein Tco_0588176 [Tanacetum coccineum]
MSHHGFSELHQLDTFYNDLNINDQDSLNPQQQGGKLFGPRMPRGILKIIEAQSKVRINTHELRQLLPGQEDLASCSSSSSCHRHADFELSCVYLRWCHFTKCSVHTHGNVWEKLSLPDLTPTLHDTRKLAGVDNLLTKELQKTSPV